MTYTAAVIGCGRMGAFTSAAVQRFAPTCWFPLAHAEAIRAHQSLSLCALSDSNAEALSLAQQAYAVERGYGDAFRMLDEVRPQLVAIATRTIGRAAIIKHAAAAGIRALHVEKPLCNSTLELEDLESALAARDIFVTYGAIRRILGPYILAKELALSGRFGELTDVQVNMGRGMLFWSHAHSADLLLFAADGRAVEGVSSRLANVRSGKRAAQVLSDPYVEAATIHFEGGIEGRITRMAGADLIFGCARGQVAVENDGHSVAVRETEGEDPYPRQRPVAIPPGAGGPGGTLAAIAMLVDCLRGQADAVAANSVVKRDILLGQRLLFAMVQSHLEGGKAVSLDAVDPAMVVLAQTGSSYA